MKGEPIVLRILLKLMWKHKRTTWDPAQFRKARHIKGLTLGFQIELLGSRGRFSSQAFGVRGIKRWISFASKKG